MAIPQLAAILKDLIPIHITGPSFGINALDYAHTDGYSAILSFIRASKNGHEDLNNPAVELKQLSNYIFSSGGRHSSRKAHKPYIPHK